MNKIAAFILSFIILFQSLSFDIQDVVKIPTLINHISCHLNGGDNLADFIEKHYGNQSETHKSEHHEHKELPFKHQHLDSHFQVAFVVYFQQYPFQMIEFIPENNNFNYAEPLTSLVVNNFFQPPKLA
ncbi:hypothetical protein SAMN06265371_101200 [Lutibacter agarilyticus]|uniref:Uncharacterized protein n=2 Tax=Lutibacter agarilyticus TaxID=1109740 RepID=A0A238VDY6_9FLAO|nr:hypothetical protein SAMN06265371_101200 [Lutibacter agarilyticus]